MKCPTLGIVGDHSQTGVRFMRTAMGSIPEAELAIIHDSFDPSNLCQTEIFNGHFETFLTRIGW